MQFTNERIMNYVKHQMKDFYLNSRYIYKEKGHMYISYDNNKGTIAVHFKDYITNSFILEYDMGTMKIINIVGEGDKGNFKMDGMFITEHFYKIVEDAIISFIEMDI